MKTKILLLLYLLYHILLWSAGRIFNIYINSHDIDIIFWTFLSFKKCQKMAPLSGSCQPARPACTGLWYTTLLHELIDNLHLHQKYLYKCLWYQNSLQGADHHISLKRGMEWLWFWIIKARLLKCIFQRFVSSSC